MGSPPVACADPDKTPVVAAASPTPACNTLRRGSAPGRVEHLRTSSLDMRDPSGRFEGVACHRRTDRRRGRVSVMVEAFQAQLRARYACDLSPPRALA